MMVPLAKAEWPGVNLLLAAIPPEEQPPLLAHLESVALRGGQVLYYAGDAVGSVYFPVNAAVAKVGVDGRGASAEWVMIGNEGFVGLNALLGDGRAAGHAVVHIPGHAYRLGIRALREVFERSLPVRQAMLRFVASRVFQTSRTSLCNARHPLAQRVARWLLQAHDRAGVPELRVTHELAGFALGVRREAVTHAALRLQACGAIRCGRGRIRVLSRARLEAAACECYALLRQDLEQTAGEIRRR